ncbi:hypothetical protein MMC09_000015 [Bachmanniomyces sp. S44760]|nr:hypothetical protein [Bachmanniomyces sp. S44760]
MSVHPNASRSQHSYDLNEQTRMAQLDRMAQLGNRLGIVPTWFKDKSLEQSQDLSAMHKSVLDKLKVDSIKETQALLAERPHGGSESTIEVEASSHKDLEIPSQPVPSSSRENDAIEDNDAMILDKETERESNPGKAMEMETPPLSMDVCERITQSPGTGSTPSKISGESSHVSTAPFDIKLEADDSNVLNEAQKIFTPASSLSSKLSPARSATPVGSENAEPRIPKRRRNSKRKQNQKFSDFRPRTSIPTNILHEELARQSVLAAYSSRLNPFALHPDEYKLLRDHICQLHVSAYLNIRNRILRLWVRNPLVSVTMEEAAGCTFSSKWLGLAAVAYEWLLRRGYINFGCVEVSNQSEERSRKLKSKKNRRKKIVIIGAGMAGLGCARQLEGLINHYSEKWMSEGEESPKVVVLEGRARIGGRIYSHALINQDSKGINGKRCIAEMGAHIITGFDHGNPLNMIIRGQLALDYYPLKDNSTLYDVNGKVVDRERDKMVEKLFNDILDRASVYRRRIPAPATADGDRALVESGRDPQGEAGSPLASDSRQVTGPPLGGLNFLPEDMEQVPGGVDKLTGKAHMVAGSRTKARPALAAEAMGWRIASEVLAYREFNLDKFVKSMEHPSLGAIMDEAVHQYQSLLDLGPQDMRLLNWHYANLEYANAANISKLSLGGWDQDIGNEFDGEHAQVIGGYQQVPRALWQYPSKLDLQTQKAITSIEYCDTNDHGGVAKVISEDGETIEAGHVVLTTPLGVLKSKTISFEPQLPPWKLESIDRLGFGTLNKVVLVYEQPFWDVDQDMVGLLRDAEIPDSLNQEEYSQNRGRFYLFWNCIKTSGRPLLIALMAGDAAHQAESRSDADIVAEVTEELAKMFKQVKVPQPSETIVTRWGKDRFAQGSYSYVAATAKPRDYDLMAQRIGNLHFAGEATCGTHPATVHGAYISGLRAASEVIDDLVGPIKIPHPLVPDSMKGDTILTTPKHDIPDGPALAQESPTSKQTRLESFEAEILKAIFAKLGLRPSKPGKSGANPFLLFSKDKWGECKSKCDDARRAALGSSNIKASRNEVRAALGQMWREASIETKKPYIDRTVNNRQVNQDSAASFQDRLASWDAEAMSIRRGYIKDHPGVLSKEEERSMWQALGVENYGDRSAKKRSGYADHFDSELEL